MGSRFMADTDLLYPDLEIISLHIAKTGGKSFVNLMKEAFGENQVTRWERSNHQVENKDWSHTLEKEALKYRVLHGHFVYNEIKHIHEKSHAKVIIWVREPVERVISRYLYLQKRIDVEENHPQKEKKDMGLLNFARLPAQRNVITSYLKGIAIEQLFFIGILEQYEQSVKEFKTLFTIEKEIEIPWENNNKEYKKQYTVTDEERQKISELNEADNLLYQEILLRKKQ
jgi:hypothetical protein